jgi:bacillolysin
MLRKDFSDEVKTIVRDALEGRLSVRGKPPSTWYVSAIMPSDSLRSIYAAIFISIEEKSREVQIMKPTRKGQSTLTRLLLSTLFISVFFFAVQPQGSAQQPAHLSIQATDLTQLRTWDAFVIDGSRTGDLRRRSVVVDPLLPTRVVERFDQFYNGVQIWGADIVRDSEGGVPRSIFGEIASPDLTLSTAPALSLEDARVALLRLGGTDALLLVWPELVISRLDSGEYRLAYTAVISGNGDVIRAFVDAQTGAELMRYSEIHRQQAVGSGTGVLGDQKKLSVENDGDTYIAYDRHRPPIIETFDMGGDLRLAKLLLSNRLPSHLRYLASDADNVWTDVAVVDAHVHVSWTYDYFYKRFGRNGIDGKNGPINIMVNAVSQQGAVTLPPSDLVYALNAFWCGSCGPSGEGLLFFGNGMPSRYAFYGQTYTYFAGALDIAAHELTHAVMSSTSNLIYRNESGALNEAFSDIMGTSVEFYYHPPGNGVGQADYVLGEDIARAVSTGTRNGNRSMANPSLYGDPDHYTKRYLGTGDSGGVHINSGIANHAFYLAIKGGTNRTSGVNVEGVGSANREQIEKVFYRAFTTLLPRSATFSMARAATIQAAVDLYGQGRAVKRAVRQAWGAVGVF